MYHIPLTEVFEFIADAGYIAHIEKSANLGSTGSNFSEAKQNLYRKFKLQENKFNDKGKLVGKETIRTLLFPKLSTLD